MTKILLARNLQRDVIVDKHADETLSYMIVDTTLLAVNGPHCQDCYKTMADMKLHSLDPITGAVAIGACFSLSGRSAISQG